MISRLNDLITEFEKDKRNNPTSADPRRLEAVVDEAEADLDTSGFAPDAVHNAFAIYFRLQKHERRLAILKQYLTGTLPPIEEAWARWNSVDALALMRKCEELVPIHKAFLDWTRSNLQPDMLLWVMEDSTQAQGWFTGGDGDDWIAIFHELNRTVPPSPRNRWVGIGRMPNRWTLFSLTVAHVTILPPCYTVPKRMSRPCRSSSGR